MDPRERTSETERRRGTVLFVDITGFTALTEKLGEEAYQPFQDCLLLLDGIARKHGGNVDKYLGDSVMAVFGIPFAIENAPRAAINAAIEMHQRVREFGRGRSLPDALDVHTGINTGVLISGDVSGPITREFAVWGHAVNVAARLKDEAPRGRIWVGPDTHRATRDDFEFEALAPMRFKGVSEPVPVYEVKSRELRLHRPPPAAGRIASPLVGREAELDRLRRCVKQVAEGRGAIATVVGDAGTGKSRLLQEVAGSEEAQHVGWYEARCVSVGSDLSFHPFAELLRARVGIGDSDDDESALAALEVALENALGDEAAESLPLLASMLGTALRSEHRERLAGIEPESLEKLVVRSMTLLLRRLAAAEPLVIVFDDVHWADGSSLGLLESLLRLARSEPILFVLTLRPGHSDTRQRILARAREHHADQHVAVELEALDRGFSEQLIENIFRDGDVPASTRRLINAKTAGNPFFIEEVVRSLLDDGAVEWRDGALFSTERLREVVIPESVQDALMARIDRLDLTTKHVLQIASIVGRTIDYRIIERLVDAAELDASLERLVDLQLLTRRTRRGGSELVISHPLIQEVASDTMLQARRRELHGKVAEAIEELLPENTPGRAGMLAYHYGRSDAPALAEEHLFQAGDEAARIAASSEALRFFREASKLYLAEHGDGGDPWKMAMLEKKIALASYHRGEFLEATRHFDRALALLGAPKPEGRARAVAVFLKTLIPVLADLYVHRRPRPRPPATDTEREVIELVFDRARAQTVAGPAEFVFDSMEGLGRLRRVDPASVIEAGGKYAGTAFLSFTGISFGMTERFLAIAQQHVDESDTREVVLVRMMRFVHKLLLGDWDPAWEIPDELIAESLRLGRLWDVTTYLGLFAGKLAYQGRFAGAAGVIEQIAKIEDLYAYDLARQNRQFANGILLLQRRQLDEALANADAYLSENDEAAVRLLALGNRAEVQALQGELEAAERTLQRAREVAAGAGTVVPLQQGPYLRARLRLDVVALEGALRDGSPAARAGRRRRSWRSGRAALRCAAKVPWEQPQVYRLLGTRCWLVGRRRAALRWWRRAVERAEQLGMEPELGSIYLEAARRLTGASKASAPRFSGLTAEECGERALGILKRVGLTVETSPAADR